MPIFIPKSKERNRWKFLVGALHFERPRARATRPYNNGRMRPNLTLLSKVLLIKGNTSSIPSSCKQRPVQLRDPNCGSATEYFLFSHSSAMRLC
jgi:hypothetical protein